MKLEKIIKGITVNDIIVVMDNGRVVETGNHETLLAAKGRYYESSKRKQMTKIR